MDFDVVRIQNLTWLPSIRLSFAKTSLDQPVGAHFFASCAWIAVGLCQNCLRAHNRPPEQSS